MEFTTEQYEMIIKAMAEKIKAQEKQIDEQSVELYLKNYEIANLKEKLEKGEEK